MSNQEKAGRIRLFISLPVPEPVRVEVEKLQKELRKLTPGGGARWVRPDQVHLTLKFLGDVDSDQTGPLVEAVREACQGFAPLKLRAMQVGFFPGEHRPRVLWVGISGATEELRSLQQAVEVAALGFGESDEDREFAAHLTLARTRDVRPAEIRAVVDRVRQMARRKFGEWVAAKIEVMKSELHPEGSRHTCLAEIPLAGAG